jgi:hypothetical protein
VESGMGERRTWVAFIVECRRMMDVVHAVMPRLG